MRNTEEQLINIGLLTITSNQYIFTLLNEMLSSQLLNSLKDKRQISATRNTEELFINRNSDGDMKSRLTFFKLET